METVSFAELLDKLAEIKVSPRQLFTYIPLPDDLVTKWKDVQAKVAPAGAGHQDIDHITLVYVKKAAADVSAERVDEIVKALRDAASDFAPIHAKVQGWGYFDGAQGLNNESATALVALVDAPGLEDLHVALKGALRRVGVEPADNHVFTPHFTFCYLKQGERVASLPRLEGDFLIDKAFFANQSVHSIPFTGSTGVEAAKTAMLWRVR